MSLSTQSQRKSPGNDRGLNIHLRKISNELTQNIIISASKNHAAPSM
jgi:hypothetical protein